MVFTGPAGSEAYFRQIDRFIQLALGKEAKSRYRIIVDDPEEVARYMSKGLAKVRRYRIRTNDAFYFNWLLRIDPSFQMPFEPTPENMRALELHRDQPTHVLASNLREMFSGIVAGNVKPDGVRAIRERGPFEIRGDADIMDSLDELLAAFVRDHRMKLPGGKAYEPCYRLVR